jgi:hypothetical protein
MTRDELTQLAREVGAELSAYINYHYDEVVVVFLQRPTRTLRRPHCRA